MARNEFALAGPGRGLGQRDVRDRLPPLARGNPFAEPYLAGLICCLASQSQSSSAGMGLAK